MKNILKLVEMAMFLFSIYLFNQFHVAWGWYLAFILLPDISMIGYLVNDSVGAVCYDIAHHKGIALAVYVTGLSLQQETIQLAGIILFGHSSMDRMMGYGLKYQKGFKFTHPAVLGE
jgi:hypothetical protein